MPTPTPCLLCAPATLLWHSLKIFTFVSTKICFLLSDNFAYSVLILFFFFKLKIAISSFSSNALKFQMAWDSMSLCYTDYYNKHVNAHGALRSLLFYESTIHRWIKFDINHLLISTRIQLRSISVVFFPAEFHAFLWQIRFRIFYELSWRFYLKTLKLLQI